MGATAAESQGRQINLLTTDIAPPHSVYITADDSIQVATQCNNAPTLVLTARILLADGSISANSWPFVPFNITGGGVPEVVSFGISEGYLLGVTLEGFGQQIRHGSIFAWITLVRGAASLQNFSQTLAFGYVTTMTPVFWPDMASESNMAGIGNPRSIVGALQAPGNEVTETVPTGVVWKLASFSMQLTPSAAAGNRGPVLVIDDGVNILHRIAPVTLPPPGTPRLFYYGLGTNNAATAFSFDSLLLPGDAYLTSGYRIRTITSNLDVGDQYSKPLYRVLEWQQL
jgi:hypothetical protein